MDTRDKKVSGILVIDEKLVQTHFYNPSICGILVIEEQLKQQSSCNPPVFLPLHT